MKKIYGIMQGDDLVNSSLQRWKAEEYCDIMNTDREPNEWTVKEFFSGVEIEVRDEAYVMSGMHFESIDELLSSLGFTITNV